MSHTETAEARKKRLINEVLSIKSRTAIFYENADSPADFLDGLRDCFKHHYTYEIKHDEYPIAGLYKLLFNKDIEVNDNYAAVIIAKLRLRVKAFPDKVIIVLKGLENLPENFNLSVLEYFLADTPDNATVLCIAKKPLRFIYSRLWANCPELIDFDDFAHLNLLPASPPDIAEYNEFKNAPVINEQNLLESLPPYCKLYYCGLFDKPSLAKRMIDLIAQLERIVLGNKLLCLYSFSALHHCAEGHGAKARDAINRALTFSSNIKDYDVILARAIRIILYAHISDAEYARVYGRAVLSITPIEHKYLIHGALSIAYKYLNDTKNAKKHAQICWNYRQKNDVCTLVSMIVLGAPLINDEFLSTAKKFGFYKLFESLSSMSGKLKTALVAVKNVQELSDPIVTVNGKEVIWRTTKAKALFLLYFQAGETGVERGQILNTFWKNYTYSSALNNLKTTNTLIRSTLKASNVEFVINYFNGRYVLVVAKEKE